MKAHPTLSAAELGPLLAGDRLDPAEGLLEGRPISRLIASGPRDVTSTCNKERPLDPDFSGAWRDAVDGRLQRGVQ